MVPTLPALCVYKVVWNSSSIVGFMSRVVLIMSGLCVVIVMIITVDCSCGGSILL